jgi:hypothetical protein
MRRRFQKGTFVKEKNGGMYCMHHIDVVRPDGTTATKQVKRLLGNLNQVSERAARREHARIVRRRPHADYPSKNAIVRRRIS